MLVFLNAFITLFKKGIIHMKKILALVSLALLASASSVFAAPATIASGAVSAAAGQVIRGGADAALADASAPLGKMSTGVKVGSAYSSAGFAVMTKHLKGSKIFGTAHDSTAIFWQPKAADVDLVAGDVGSTVGNSAFATGWTSM
jgi:hypothetical protein